MSKLAPLLAVGCFIGMSVCRALAWPAPQDHWVEEPDLTWGKAGTAAGEFGWAAGVALGEGKVFVADQFNHRIQVFTPEGEFLSTFGSSGNGAEQMNRPWGIAYREARLYVADSENRRVQVFQSDGASVTNWPCAVAEQSFRPIGIAVDDTHMFVTDYDHNRVVKYTLDGVQVLAWGEAGSVVGQFSLPTNLAVDRRYVYVADAANRRIQIFDKGGAFVRSWTDPANQGYDIWGVAVDDASIYIAGRQRGSGLYPYNMRLWITDKTGAVRGTCSWLGATTQDSVAPFGIAVGSPYLYVATLEDDRVHTVRRIYRTLGAVTNNAIPLAEVYAVKQREGTHTIDIDYVVSDPDDATVTVYAIAFAGVTNDTPGLAEVMPVRTLLEGTASNVGPGIATGPVHRLTWDSGTDGLAEKIADYGALRVALLVRDGRAPLDLHMLELPAVGTGAALTINRAPLFDEDLLPLWFWLLAAGDADIALNAGELRGVSGDYAGQPLAQGVNTTALGRQFMFERLGYREATPEELTYAREATTPGSVTYREPRREPPRAGYKVNEFNFVTDPTNGWWVVPLAP